MTDTRRLRGAGIGAGYFAPFQYEAWTRIPEVEIVGIYNRTAERARPLMSQYGIPRFYEDWKEMLERERRPILNDYPWHQFAVEKGSIK